MSDEGIVVLVFLPTVLAAVIAIAHIVTRPTMTMEQAAEYGAKRELKRRADGVECSWVVLDELQPRGECHPKTITYEDYMERDVCPECGRPLDGNGFQARYCSWCGRKVVRP